MPEKILVLDEDGQVRQYLSDLLAGEGYTVLTAAGLAAGGRMFKAQAADLVIADARMAIGELLDMLAQFKVDLIILVSPADQVAAIDWLDKGVYDQLPKPPADGRLAVATVRRAMEKRRLVVQHSQAIQALEESDIRDPLTGLYNQRHMHTCLLDEIVRSARYQHHFLMMIADIDNLKNINDIHGMAYGDMVLTRTARLLEDNLRITDTIFRYDGGKFLMLLPETRKSQAVCVAERILEGVRYHDFSRDGVRAQVTISMGAAEFPSEARELSSLLGLAGNRLTGAKDAGRDCFCFKTYETLPSD